MRINPHKTQIGSFIPNGIMELNMIGSNAKLIYGRLCQFAGKNGYCWPAISTLAIAIGCSKTTVKKSIKDIIDAKLVEVEHRYSESGDATSNLYFFLDHPALHIYPLNSEQISAPLPAVSDQPKPEAGHKEDHLRGSINSKRCSIIHRPGQLAAAPLPFDFYLLPIEIEVALNVLPLDHIYKQQVKIFAIKKLNSNIHETEVLACLTIFRERLPGLRNKKNPCSLLAKLFADGAGKEYLAAVNEAKIKEEEAAQIKLLEGIKYAKEQTRLQYEAEEWMKTQDIQKLIKLGLV